MPTVRPRAARLGTFLYWVGSIGAVLGFAAAGLTVVHHHDDAYFWFPIYCGSALAAWGIGRLALYVLAGR